MDLLSSLGDALGAIGGAGDTTRNTITAYNPLVWGWNEVTGEAGSPDALGSTANYPAVIQGGTPLGGINKTTPDSSPWAPPDLDLGAALILGGVLLVAIIVTKEL